MPTAELPTPATAIVRGLEVPARRNCAGPAKNSKPVPLARMDDKDAAFRKRQCARLVDRVVRDLADIVEEGVERVIAQVEGMERFQQGRLSPLLPKRNGRGALTIVPSVASMSESSSDSVWRQNGRQKLGRQECAI